MIRSCPSCSTHNRIPSENLADVGRCGACQAELPPLSRPVEVDASAFDEIVRAAKVPVLVDFWAGWCAPCRMAAPEVEKLAEDMAGRALVLKVDTESCPELAERFGVRAIPNFVVLRNGKIALQRAGFAGRAQMKDWIANAAAGPANAS